MQQRCERDFFSHSIFYESLTVIPRHAFESSSQSKEYFRSLQH